MTALSQTPPLRASVSLSSRAAEKIIEFGGTGSSQSILRLTVDGGGCSGFQYRFDMIASADQDDLVIERDGAKLAVDQVSLPYVLGSEVDFVDELIGAAFKVKNPNATSSCGCGTSFSI